MTTITFRPRARGFYTCNQTGARVSQRELEGYRNAVLKRGFAFAIKALGKRRSERRQPKPRRRFTTTYNLKLR